MTIVLEASSRLVRSRPQWTLAPRDYYYYYYYYYYYGLMTTVFQTSSWSAGPDPLWTVTLRIVIMVAGSQPYFKPTIG